jgi:hypothetical protein
MSSIKEDYMQIDSAFKRLCYFNHIATLKCHTKLVMSLRTIPCKHGRVWAIVLFLEKLMDTRFEIV